MEILFSYLPFILLWPKIVLGTPLMLAQQVAETADMFKPELPYGLQIQTSHMVNQSPGPSKLKPRSGETRRVPDLFPDEKLMSLYDQGLQLGECRCRKRREHFKLPLGMKSISHQQAEIFQSVKRETLHLWYLWDAECHAELGITKPQTQPSLGSMEQEMQLHAYQAGSRIGECMCEESLIPRDATEIIQEGEDPQRGWKEKCEKNLFQEIEQRRAKLISLVERKLAEKRLEDQQDVIKEGRRKSDNEMDPNNNNHFVFSSDMSWFKRAASARGSHLWKNFATLAAKVSGSPRAETPRAFGPVNNNAPMGFSY